MYIGNYRYFLIINRSKSFIVVKMKSKILLCCLVLAFAAVSCDVFEYHPYDIRLKDEYKDINRRNLEWLKTLERHSDTVRFVFMGDSQRWYDETEALVESVNARSDIDFVIHGGDISDFGMKKEFCWIHDIMNGLKMPYMAIIGNHDHLGSGGEIYTNMYGELNFAFVYGGIKFLALNTNALEFDYSTPVPDFQFLKQQLTDSLNESYDRTIVMMHAEPGDVVFNNNVKDVFQEYLKRFKNLMFCVHAHDHALQKRDLFEDGIVYYGSDCLKHRSYLVFTVIKDKYEYEVVYF